MNLYGRCCCAVTLIAAIWLGRAPDAAAQRGGGTATSLIASEALAQVRKDGSIRVIVRIDLRVAPEAHLGAAQAEVQRQDIDAVQRVVLGGVSAASAASARRFRHIPYISMTVDEADLQTLAAMREVASIHVDRISLPALAESVPLVRAPDAWAQGHSGAGWSVAILDTGVDKNHSFLAGKVISEGCYSSTSNTGSVQSTSVCPGGLTSTTAPGSAMPCSQSGCWHGTHVAGTAAGKGTAFSGVAKDASIIAIQVFSAFATGCGSAPSICSFQSDQIAGLERVYELRTTFNIAAVNLSLGGGVFTQPCDSEPEKAYIDQLRAAGIPTIVAAGNDGATNGISAPACISSAISVGATTDGSGDGVTGDPVPPPDVVSSFSNSATFLTLLAPGQWITSSIPGGGFATSAGTSMAAPHVAGAWAVLKSRYPEGGVAEITNALIATGVPVVDQRNGLTKPRIDVGGALASLPVTCAYSVSPARVLVPRTGGTATVTVDTSATCAWSVTVMSPFISIITGSSGIGLGTVGLSVARNTVPAGRQGTVTIAGTTVIVAQGGSSAGDLNGDGHADLVWQNVSNGSLATWYLDGRDVIATLSLSINRVADPDWRIVGAGDLDGDGFSDLVWQHKTLGWLAAWFMRGNQVVSTEFLTIDNVPPTYGWEIRGVGDTNGDGYADLVWQNRFDGSLATWYMRGTQVLSTQYLSISRVLDPDWQIVGAGDTDGDGFADLVWQNRADGSLAVWSLRGVQVTGTAMLSIPRLTDLNWRIAGVGDVDGDGKADLLWQNDATGELGVWTLNGTLVVGQWNLSIPQVADTSWRAVGPG